MSDKYKKEVNFLNNDEFNTEQKYIPSEVIERVFNTETEQYEYKTKLINLELEWENEMEIRENILIESESFDMEDIK